MQLLEAEQGEGHYAWIDDRFLNSYGRCGDVPIITTLGVIEELHRRQAISTTKYHALRHRLRASDFRYVPLNSEEIVEFVTHAPVEDGHIVETPELSVLRRYHARVLLDHEALQLPPLQFKSPNPEGRTQLAPQHFGSSC